MKKQATAIQELTESWSVPLMPCPLVQPPASRAPKAISNPPAKAAIMRSAWESAPKRAAHIGGNQRPVSSPPVHAARKEPIKMPTRNSSPQSGLGGLSW